MKKKPGKVPKKKPEVVKSIPPAAMTELKIPKPIEMDLSVINKAIYNPRFMPKEKMAALKASLRKHGLVLNLVIQLRADDGTPNVLIGGHQRLQAMFELCKEHNFTPPKNVTVVVLDVNDAEAKQLNVALNNVEGEFDPVLLGQLFADIRPNMTMDDILATGFTPTDIDESIALTLPLDEQIARMQTDDDGVGSFAQSITMTVDFETVEKRDTAKDLLKQMVVRSGKRAGDIVLAALKSYSITPRKRAAA